MGDPEDEEREEPEPGSGSSRSTEATPGPRRFPERPRLHDGVIVRRHVCEDGDWVVIHDESRGHVLRYEPVHFRVAALADGTRDVEGILLAARREGIAIEEHDLLDFLEQLHDWGALTDGPGTPPLRATNAGELSGRTLVRLPDFRFECSGRGVCCSAFPSILFTELDVARARSVLPRFEHDFLPHRGVGPEGPFVPPLYDGRCWYLAEDGRCRLHAEGGLDWKPSGCSLFPAVLTDDGEEIRVSASLECACVLDGIGAQGSSGLLPADADTLADLDPATKVESLPERLAVDATTTADRSEARDWFRRLSEVEAPPDVAAGLWAMADAMSEGSLTASIEAYRAAPPVDPSALQPWLRDAVHHLGSWAETHAKFRSEGDLTASALRWITLAARSLLDRCGDHGAFVLPPSECHVEAFYVRADTFAYRWIGPLPLATAVRIRAIRIWLARVLLDVEGAREDERASAPLPLVEMMFRAHGLDAFSHGRV